MSVGDGVGLAVCEGVGVCDGVGVIDGVGVGEGVGVREGVGVGDVVGVTVIVGVGVTVGVGVGRLRYQWRRPSALPPSWLRTINLSVTAPFPSSCGSHSINFTDCS